MSDPEKTPMEGTRFAAAMSFGSAGACFASLLAIIAVEKTSCWLKVAFALFAVAGVPLVTAGLIFVFVVCGDIDQERGTRLGMRFVTPAYFVAATGMCALVGSVHWLLALAVSVLIAIGYVAIKRIS